MDPAESPDRTAAPSPADILRRVSAGQGFNAWLGVDLVAAGEGRVDFVVPVRPEILQHHGHVHGGVIGALADTACAWAAATVAGDVVTATYTVQFLAPARGARLRATGEVLKSGRRSVSVEARVYAEAAGEERLVAVALAAITPLARP